MAKAVCRKARQSQHVEAVVLLQEGDSTQAIGRKLRVPSREAATLGTNVRFRPTEERPPVV